MACRKWPRSRRRLSKEGLMFVDTEKIKGETNEWIRSREDDNRVKLG